MNKSFELTPTRLRELRGFAAAARLMNFSRAALEVGCTPSVLSRRIASLEAVVGANLFLRTTRRMSLTTRGEALLSQCERLEAVALDLAQSLRRGSEIEGRLCLHLPSAYGRACIAPLLAEFARRHPQLRIDAQYSDSYVDLITHRIDLAVRVGELPDSKLIARRVGTMRRQICAAPKFFADAHEPNDPVELREQRCIAFSGLRTGTLWQFSQGRGRRSVRLDPVMVSNDAQAIRDAVLAGVGIAMLGDYMAAPLIAAGRLIEVLPRWRMVSAPIHLIWVSGADRAAPVRALIDFLAQRIAPA